MFSASAPPALNEDGTVMTAVHKMNPLGGASDEAPLSLEVFDHCPAPLCCVTAGSVATTVSAEEVFVRQNKTLCELPVSMGAGYELTSFAIAQITRYGMRSSQAACSAPRGAVFVAARPTGYAESALVNGSGLEDFLARLWRLVPAAMGRPVVPSGTPPMFGSTTATRGCGALSHTLAFHENGLATLEEVEKLCCSELRSVAVASLDDAIFVRHERAPCLQEWCFGRANDLEVSFGQSEVHRPTRPKPCCPRARTL
jgi:hypothetical protein